MALIFVNGISAKAGGGMSILENFLKSAGEDDSEHKFYVIVPNGSRYLHIKNSKISFVSLGWLSHTILLPITNAIILPLLIRLGRYDAVFNLADLPIPTKTPQTFLFDWPYAAYPNSPAWDRCTRTEYVLRRVKLWFFRYYLKYIDHMIAQTPHMRRRLMENYDLEVVHVVPNAVSLDNIRADSDVNFDFGEGFKLLCLSHYYTHKNIEILVDVAHEIKRRKLDLKIVITIAKSHGFGAKWTLQRIETEGLEDVIVNVGPVPMNEVPDLYRQTDALILPTMLESFSGTYVEALFHEKPIFTSDEDFARSVCGEAAFYFNQYDVSDILATILRGIEDPVILNEKVSEGNQLLQDMPGWPQAFSRFRNIIEDSMGKTIG